MDAFRVDRRERPLGQPADIDRWAGIIRAQTPARDAYVYFKHEEQGKGPEFANLLKASLGVTSPERASG